MCASFFAKCGQPWAVGATAEWAWQGKETHCSHESAKRCAFPNMGMATQMLECQTATNKAAKKTLCQTSACTTRHHDGPVSSHTRQYMNTKGSCTFRPIPCNQKPPKHIGQLHLKVRSQKRTTNAFALLLIAFSARFARSPLVIWTLAPWPKSVHQHVPRDCKT